MIYTYVYVCLYSYVCIYKQTHTYIYIYLYRYIYIYIYPTGFTWFNMVKVMWRSNVGFPTGCESAVVSGPNPVDHGLFLILVD